MIVLLKRMIVMALLLCLIPMQGYGMSAQSAVVLEQSTGKVLWESNSRQQLGMASTTKIMTAVVTLEHADPLEFVTVGKNAAGVEGSSICLEEGEQLTVEDLLYGLMLNSGNDAAVALAEHIGGTVEHFCDLMNQKAQEIGAVNTHFENPNGLPQDGHYTTAYDLGLIACYALKNPFFCKIVSTRETTIAWNGRDYGRKLSNHNKMLRLYEGCDGVKTGFTKSTGRALVTSATRNGMQVVAVTLNDPDDWRDHTDLLDRAFSEFRKETVLCRGETVTHAAVQGGKRETCSLMAEEELALICPKEEQPDVQVKTTIFQADAPISRGMRLGEAQLYADGKMIGKTNLLAAESVSSDSWKRYRLTAEQLLERWMGAR